MKKSFLIFCFILCFCSNLYALATFPSTSIPKNVSDFTLPDLSGKSVSLSDFKGKAVILFFWTTWCPHCRKQLADFGKEYQNMESLGIELISIDIGEPGERIVRFLKDYSVQFPVLLDLDGEVANKYGVVGIPTIILISKKGEIVSVSYTFPDNYKSLLLE